jgi:hypothetical protein
LSAAVLLSPKIHINKGLRFYYFPECPFLSAYI